MVLNVNFFGVYVFSVILYFINLKKNLLSLLRSSTLLVLEHSDVQCYTCMDVKILETDRTPDSTAPDLVETLIDVIFKPRGIDPPPCDRPALLHCPDVGRPVCHSYRATYSGTCEYKHIPQGNVHRDM